VSALAAFTAEQRRFLEDFERTTRETFEELDAVMPFGILFAGESVDFVVLEFSTPERKAKSLEYLRERATRVGAHAACIVSETWYVMRDRDSVDLENPPSAREQADRREGIIISFETALSTAAGIAEVVPGKGGGRTFGSLEWSESVVGEAQGIIPRAASPSRN